MTRYEFEYVQFRDLFFPVIPVQLTGLSGRTIATNALVDSGASISLFDGQIGGALGLEVGSGKQIVPAGVGGSLRCYVHEVKLRIGNEEEFQAAVAFTHRTHLPMNLLGRAYVFDRFLVTFDEQTRKTILETRKLVID